MSHRVVVTAGHVDHGKSTLLRALTGMEPDRLAEERRRGLSIALGFVWTRLDDVEGAAPVTVAFVDVPGHERFVSTMLAGAGAAPATLLVVAADDGWSAQSSEHRDALDLLGVPAAAVVVTKADQVEAEPVEAVVAEVEGELAGTSLAGTATLVVDGVSGRGVDALRAALHTRLAELPDAVDRGRPRLWVDRAFTITGAGTVVTGTLTEGRLERGDTARVLGRGTDDGDLEERPVGVRGLQALGRRVDAAGPDTRVAVNLAGIELDQVTSGDVLVAGGPWRTTSIADLWLRPVGAHRVEGPGAWHLHVGTTSTTRRVLTIAGALEGEPGAVRVVLDAALPLVAGDRVVLREAGRRATVAGGAVVDPDPGASPRGTTARRAHVERLATAANAPPERRPETLLALTGGVRATDALRAAAGWPSGRDLPTDVIIVGGWAVAADVHDRWTAAVRGLGAGTHDRNAVVEAARAAGATPDVAGALVDQLVAEGALVRTAGGFALPEHAEAATAGSSDRAATVVAALAAEPFTPPDLDEVARREGLDHRQLAALIGRGGIVRCGKVAFARSAIDDAVAHLVALEREVGAFTAAQAKASWGTTRRYAIPLLEHLDARGITDFDGQHRRLRSPS